MKRFAMSCLFACLLVCLSVRARCADAVQYVVRTAEIVDWLDRVGPIVTFYSADELDTGNNWLLWRMSNGAEFYMTPISVTRVDGGFQYRAIISSGFTAPTKVSKT